MNRCEVPHRPEAKGPPPSLAVRSAGDGAFGRAATSRIFAAFLLPALVMKGCMVLYDLSEAAEQEWIIQLLGRASLLLWGRELISAVVLTAAACLWLRAFRGCDRRRRVWAQLPVDLLILGHAVFCALAFAYFREEGDFATCAVFGLVESQGESAGLGASVLAAMTPTSVLVLAICMASAAWGCRRVGPRFWGWRRGTRTMVVGLLIFEALVGIVVVPQLVRGELPLRFKSHGLERNPLSRLVSSCIDAGIDRAELGRHGHARRVDHRSPIGEFAAAPAWSVQPRRTNVVILLLESVMDPVAFDQLDAMPKTARLLARPEVVHLSEHYATWSLTTHSSYSILSGEYASPEVAPVVGRKPGLAFETLPDRLRAEGYATWFFSSQDLAFDRQAKFYARHGFDAIRDQSQIEREGVWSTGWGVDDRETLRRALAQIDAPRAPDAPFFLVVQTATAHHPYELPPDAGVGELGPDATRAEKYARGLRFLDDRIEQLFEGLAARGHADDTLVLVVSDHGEGWDEFKGRNVAEPNIRPLAFLRGPQLPSNAVEAMGPSSHIDLAPTLLSLLGLEAPCAMTGRDLSRGGRSDVLFFAGRPPRSQRGLRDGKWRFVLEDGKGELYDLEADPLSREDLARVEPERHDRYMHWLEDWSVNVGWRVEHAGAIRRGCEEGRRPFESRDFAAANEGLGGGTAHGSAEETREGVLPSR